MKIIRAMFLLLCLPAFADNARTISSVSDMLEGSEVDPIVWYQGESVTLDVFAKRGNERVAWPSTASSVLRVWLESSPSTLYVNKTNDVYAAGSGQTRNTLTPAQSNLATNDYKFSVAVYDSSTFMGIAAEGDLEVRYAPQTGLDIVTPQEQTDDDTLGALTPSAGALVYGTGSAWTNLAAGTSGYFLRSNGAAAPSWASAASGDITGGAVSGGLLTVSEAAGILTYGLTTSTVRSAVSGIYLPLSGGTMTGNISIPGMGATATAYGEGFRVENEGDTKESSIGFSGLYVRNGSAYATVENDSTNTVFSSSAGVIVRPGAMAEITLDGDVSVEGALTGSGTNLAGIVKLPTGAHSGGVDLIAIDTDGTTPIYVPTESVWNGFSAYVSTNIACAGSSALTTVKYQTETRDTLGLYDTTTGYFRPNKTGLWRITAGMLFTENAATAGRSVALRIYNVGTSTLVAPISELRLAVTGFIPNLINGSVVVQLTSGTDYRFDAQNGDTVQHTVSASSTYSVVTAEFITP